MIVLPFAPLAPRTTFRIGGPARWWVEVFSVHELLAAFQWARERGAPFVVMGEGANALVPDEGFPGVVARLRMERIWIDPSERLVVAEGGAHWDTVVDTTTRAGWWGLERLAAIPGTAGAAVVQNIGAYGAEASDTLAWADIVDPRTGQMRRVGPEELAFAYRTSALKEGALRGWVVTRAAWRLFSKPRAPRQPYPAVEALLADARSPREAATHIRAVRSNKLPDMARWGTAGSFFQNPTLPPAHARELLARFPDVPHTPLADGSVRVALAWLLDHVLGLRGFRMGSARLYERQPLVVVVDPQARASARDVRALAREVARRTRDAFNITLVPEVETLLPEGFARCVWC